MTDDKARALLRRFLEWYDTDLAIQDAHDLADDARALLDQPAPEGDRWRCAWCGTALGECKCVAQPVPEGGTPESNMLWEARNWARRKPAPEPYGKCSVCLGEPLKSGRECICGGVGTEAAEMHGLRVRCFDLQDRLDAVSHPLSRAEAEAMIAEYVTARHSFDTTETFADFHRRDRAYAALLRALTGEGT